MTQRHQLHEWSSSPDLGWCMIYSPKDYPWLSSLVVKFGSQNEETAQGDRKSSGFMISGLEFQYCLRHQQAGRVWKNLRHQLSEFSPPYNEVREMILKDTSTPIFYDGENTVVSISPSSLAEGVEEGTEPPTTGSGQGKAMQSLQISTSSFVFTLKTSWLKSSYKLKWLKCKRINTKCWEGCEDIGMPIQCCWEGHWYSLDNWEALLKLTIQRFPFSNSTPQLPQHKCPPMCSKRHSKSVHRSTICNG